MEHYYNSINWNDNLDTGDPMNKSNITVEHLQRALGTLPDDNAFLDARSFIRNAISEITEVEHKREKRKGVVKAGIEQRETAAQKWGHAIGVGLAKPLTKIQAKNALDKIEQMIEAEKGKEKEQEKEQIIRESKAAPV